MVAENYACAYKEVIEILKYTRREDVNKIPLIRILGMKYNMNKNHNFQVDVSKPLKEQTVLPETKAVLVNLYKKYWATDYEKERIEAKEKYDKELMEQAKREEYNPDEIFKNNKETKIDEEKVNTEEATLVKIKDMKWYDKVFSFFRRLFGKSK